MTNEGKDIKTVSGVVTQVWQTPKWYFVRIGDGRYFGNGQCTYRQGEAPTGAPYKTNGAGFNRFIQEDDVESESLSDSSASSDDASSEQEEEEQPSQPRAKSQSSLAERRIARAVAWKVAGEIVPHLTDYDARRISLVTFVEVQRKIERDLLFESEGE